MELTQGGSERHKQETECESLVPTLGENQFNYLC